MILKLLSNRRGWGLAEVIVTVAVMAALATPVVASHVNKYQDALAIKAKGDIAVLTSAAYQYRSDTGAFPATAATLETVVGGKGPWIKSRPVNDPWGKPYTYSATTGQFTSSGPDKKAGTADDITGY